jgi:dihydropyrimidinase
MLPRPPGLASRIGFLALAVRKVDQLHAGDHTYPSLKYPEDQKRLWAAINRGAIQVVATDELCCLLRVKLRGSRIDDTTGGNSGVEPRVALMYTNMVTKRGYPAEHFVDMISSNAARIMGLYPRKGPLVRAR